MVFRTVVKLNKVDKYNIYLLYMSLPFTTNKFLPINIKDTNAVTGTYGGVSILNNGKTELKSDTTITRLGVNKNVNSSYQVDVAGDVNVSGQFFVNGVPFSSGAQNVYGLISSNTTLTSASPNFIAIQDVPGFGSITLPDTSTLVLGKQYTFFLINSGTVTINTHAGQTYYNDAIPSGNAFTLTPTTQSCVFVVISTTANPRWVLYQVEQDISTIFGTVNVWTNDNQFSRITDGLGTEIEGGAIITNSVTSNTYLNPNKASDGVLSVAVSTTPYNIAFGDARTILFTGTGIVQTVILPAVTADNLGTTFTIIRANSNQMIIQAPSGLTFYDNDNNAISGLTLFSNTRVVSFTAIATTGTIWAMTYSQDPNKNLAVTISNTQSISGTKNFATTNFSVLPSFTGTLGTLTNTNLITKLYADTNYQLSSGMTAYLTTATAASTYQPLSGMTAYLTTASASSTYQPLSGMTAYLTTASASSTYQPLSGMTAYLTTASASSTYQPLSGMTAYLTTASASSTYQTIAGMSSYSTTTTADATYSRLTVANNFSAQNTFTTFLPLYSGSATPTSNNFITRQYADNNYHPVGSAATLNGTNTFTAQNQFNTFLPLYSGTATPLASNFIIRSFADGQYGRLTTNNNWTLTNSFATLPNYTGSASPAATDFITRNAGDARYAQLGAPNTFTSITTFNNGVYINNTLEVDTIGSVLLNNSASGTVGYGRYNFTADTYTNTMLNSSFTKTVGIQTCNTGVFTNTITADFQAALPIYSGTSPVYANNTFFPRSYGDTRYAQLAATNSFSGTTNTFTNSLIANNFLPYFPLNIGSLRMGLYAMRYANSSAFANIAIGESTLQGDSITPANNTGSKNICIGYYAGAGLTTNSGTSPDDNVLIGYGAGSNLAQVGNAYAGPSYSNVIIGSNCGQNGWIQKSVLIGANVASSGAAFLSDSTIVGYNSGVTISDKSGVSIFGASNLPVYNGNGGQAFGCQLGTYANNNDKGLFCGINSGGSLNTGWACVVVGGDSMNGIGTGGGGCFFGGISVDTTKSDIKNSVAIGSFFNVNEDDTFKIGGYNIVTGAYQNLLIGNKNRILFNTDVTIATQALTFEMGEHINITTNTTTNITLPVPVAANIGARFTIVKSYTTPVAITITASAGLTIYASSGNTNTYSFLATEYYVTLICINTTGTAWIVTNEDTSKQFVDLTSNQSNIQGTKTFTSTNGSLSVSTFNFENVNNNTLNYTNVNLTHTKSTAAVVGDNCGIISFDMKNSTTSVSTRYATIGVNLNNATAGSENSIVYIVGKSAGADLNYMNLGGGISALTLPIRVNNYWPSTAFNSLLTSATTLTYGGGNSFYKYYSVQAAATAYTITLPTIDAAHLGNEIQFRRVGGTTTTVVSFIGNGSQNVYNTALTGGLTAQGLMASGVYIVRLVPMLLTNTPTYAWFQM